MLPFRRSIALLLSITFMLMDVVPPAYAQSFVLPAHNALVALSVPFTPALLRGIQIHPQDPFKFDFIVNQGDETMSREHKRDAYLQLIKYFLASLTIPDEEQWVNLSPYEKDRIIADAFGQTEMGRDLLGQDYLLKQLTASAMFPESDLGRSFWAKVYQEVSAKLAPIDIPLDAFNRVWITPDKAVVYEKDNVAYIGEMHLKVQLEDDYLAGQKTGVQDKLPKAGFSSDVKNIMRQIILPSLENEVNKGKNFAQLRQIFSGMVLATWYKRSLKESLLGKIYTDKSKVLGVEQKDVAANQQIYARYLQAFHRGVYNYIKEEYDPLTQITIPRKYFSGGIVKDLSLLEIKPVTGFTGIVSTEDEAVSLTLDPAQSVQQSTRVIILALVLSLLSGVNASLAAPPGLSPVPEASVVKFATHQSIGSALIVGEMSLSNGNIRQSNAEISVVQDLDSPNRNAVAWSWQYPGGFWTTASWGGGAFLDLKMNLKDLVFRFTISGTERAGYDLVFEDDKGHEIGYSSTEHIQVQSGKQYALVRLDLLKARNPAFNWSKVRPVKFKSITGNGNVLIQEPVILDVGKTRKLGVGVGMFEGNGFPALTGWPSVLSFTSIYMDPQELLGQWQGLHPGQVPHEVMEFDAYPGNGTVLERINRGEFDPQLIARAKVAREYAKPVLLRTLHEPMGGWYGWSVKSQQDADNYVEAWKRVVRIYRENGADKVAFGFSPHNYEPSDIQQSHTYELADYILGRIQQDVDVIAIDTYSYPPGGGQFNVLITGMVSRFEKYGIPFMMGEMGSAMPEDNKLQTWTYLLTDLQNGMYPNFVAFVPFDVAKMENGGWKDFHIPSVIKAELKTNKFFSRDPFPRLLREKSKNVNSFINRTTSQIASWVWSGTNKILFTFKENGREEVAMTKGNDWGGLGFALDNLGVAASNYAQYSLVMALTGDISAINLILEDGHKNAQGVGNEVLLKGDQLARFVRADILKVNLRTLLNVGERKGDVDPERLEQVKIAVVGDGVITIGQPLLIKDQAQINASDLGGIDLNARNLNMTILRDGDGVALPAEQQNVAGIRIAGLVPVILNIQPVARVLKF